MANYCDCSIKMLGAPAEVAEVKRLVDAHTQDPNNGEKVTDFDEIVGQEAREWGVRWDEGADNSLIWYGYLSWKPPSRFVAEMSRRYPEAEFVMSFSVGEENRKEKYSYRNGVGRRTYFQQGYFESCNPEVDPVLCWDIFFSFESEEQNRDILARLYSEGILIRGELENLSKWPPEAILAWIHEHFPDVAVEEADSTPLTLDEGYYLYDVCDLTCRESGALEPVGPYHLPDGLHDLLRIVERDLPLIPKELDWIAQSLIERIDPYTSIVSSVDLLIRIERLRNHIGRAHFDERYLERIREKILRNENQWFEHWFVETSEEESLSRGHGHPLEPTGPELHLLLDKYHELDSPEVQERIAHINDALRRPRWSEEWPMWDWMARRGEERRQAIAERHDDENDVDDGDDFLRSLSSDDEDLANWEKEGF